MLSRLLSTLEWLLRGTSSGLQDKKRHVSELQIQFRFCSRLSCQWLSLEGLLGRLARRLPSWVSSLGSLQVCCGSRFFLGSPSEL